MESYIQDLLNADIDIFLSEVQKKLITELPHISNCIILYGNEPWFIEAYFRKVISHQGKKPVICDMISDDYMSQVDNIKEIKTLQTLTNEPNIIYIKNITKGRCKLFHHIIDRMDNMVLFIEGRDVDTCIQSRSFYVNLATPKETMKKYFEISDDKFDDAYNKSLGTLSGTTLRLKHNPSIDICLLSLLNKLINARSFLVVMTDIKDFVQKIFHLNIPLSYLCRVIISHYEKKLSDDQMRMLAEISAKYDHKINTTYKDLFVYERYFMHVLEIFKERGKKQNV